MFRRLVQVAGVVLQCARMRQGQRMKQRALWAPPCTRRLPRCLVQYARPVKSRL